MRGDQKCEKARPRFRTKWGELEQVCAKIHNLWYVEKKESTAKRYLGRLQRVLREVPDNDMAILREDGLALLHELRGEIGDAIKHRKREIQLMTRLHRDVEANGYAEEMKASILVDRDAAVLQERRTILKSLRVKQKSGT
jgi:hypothetical protein